VPRIAGLRFLEEPQTNWRTIDTKKTFGHEPAHTWDPRARGCRRKRTHAASIAHDGDATCVTIPVPHQPPRPERSCRRRRYRRRSQSSPLSSKSSKNPPSRALPSADPAASSIARHRRRRSTRSLAFLEIPRSPPSPVCVCVCVCVCVSPRDIRPAIFHAFFPASRPFPFSLRSAFRRNRLTILPYCS